MTAVDNCILTAGGNEMFGLIKSGFVFSTGTAFGIYLAQNYRMPDIAAVVSALVSFGSLSLQSNILANFVTCVNRHLCKVQTKKANNAAEDHKK